MGLQQLRRNAKGTGATQGAEKGQGQHFTRNAHHLCDRTHPIHQSLKATDARSMPTALKMATR